MNEHRGEKSIADALRESEERFRVLVEGIALTIWETDASGMTIVDSPSWRAFTGQQKAPPLSGTALSCVVAAV